MSYMQLAHEDDSAIMVRRRQLSRTLSRYGFFKNADESLRREILDASEWVELEKGVHLFRRGDAIPCVGFVERGDVRVYLTGESGREVTLYHVGPGESCPITMICTLRDQPAMANARIEANVSAAILPCRDVARWARTEPAFTEFVFEAYATRLIDVFLRVEEVTFQGVNQRLTEYLMKQFCRSDVGMMPVKVTHEQLASEIGSAREVVTRVLKTFEKQGAIKLGRGVIEPRDVSRLCRNANQ